MEYYIAMKMERSNATFYNMNDPYKHNTEWKEPDTNKNLLYDKILKHAELSCLKMR